MSENFEIVPRHDDTPAAKETTPNMLSILETVADGFGKVIAAFIGGVGQAIAGVALGAAKFAGHIVDAAKEIAGGIAKAIKGEGASMKVISGAVDERLGPLDTAITEAGEKFSEISDKVDESIREQDRLHEDMVKNDELITQTREEAEQARLDRVAAEQTMNNEIASALRKAESAQTSADGKSTIYYGTATPKSPKAGDTWFKQGAGGSQILQFVGGKWVQHTDFAQLDKDLADNKKAVEKAARDVAAAQAKVDKLVNDELPSIKNHTAGLSDELAAEKRAREQELAAANQALTNAKLDLGKSMGQLEERLKLADTQLKTAMDGKVRDDLEAAKRDLGLSMSQLETRLKDADKLLEERVGKAATKELEDAKVDLEKSLKANADALATARDELDTLNVARPGNIFPDPFFEHESWHIKPRPSEGGLLLPGRDRNQERWWKGASTTFDVPLEPGASYLITMDVRRPNKTRWVQLMTSARHVETNALLWANAAMSTVSETNGVELMSGVLTVPKVSNGKCNVAIKVESAATDADMWVNNVRMVRAADNSLVLDGAITAAKVQAGAIETSKLAADAVTADKIKAGQITAGKLAANSVTADNLQADAVTARSIKSDQILTKHIKAGQVTASEIASKAITADQIAAGTITADELGANSVTSKQIKADAVTADKIKSNSIYAEHMVIGGPANMIANGSFTEGKEPWALELSIRAIGTDQQIPPGDRYAITKPGEGTVYAHTGNQWMTVTPNTEYAFEIWLYADKPNSVFFIDLWNQYGTWAGRIVGGPMNEGDTLSGNVGTARLVDNLTLKKGWHRYSCVYRTDKNTTRIKLANFYFNHSNGSERNAQIAFSGISLRPMTGANLIVNGAVVADKLAANAVTARSIASDQIFASHIKSGQVTTSALAADAVTADKIKANQITGDKLTADAITSREVKSNSIYAEHMVIGGPANMIANGNFSQGKEPWHKDLIIREIDTSQKLPPGNAYAIAKAGQTMIWAHTGEQWMDVTPEGMYAFEIWLYADKPGSRFYLELRDQYGNLAGAAQREKVNVGDVSAAGGGGYLVNNVEVRQGWNKYSTVYKMNPNTTRVRLGGFYFNHENGRERNAKIGIAGVSLRPMADADLIVDGAILAQHIKSGTITGNEIAGDTITGTKLKADTITGREVKAGTINASQLKVDNGWIKNAMIGNAEIDSSKIKSIDAGSITTGTMSGKRIDADSITVRQIRANSIIPIGGSLIPHEPPPSDDTKPPEPIWWQVCDNELAEDYGGAGSTWKRPEGNPWRMSSGAGGEFEAPAVPQRLVKVKPGQKYKLKVWLRATVANSKMFIELRDQNGRLPTIYNAPHTSNAAGKAKHDPANKWDVADFDQTFEGGKVDQAKARAGNYLLENYTLHTYPTLVTATVWFGRETEYVSLSRIYFNHDNGSAKGNQWIAGLSLELDIPDQAEVDRLQDENAKRIEDGVKLNTKFSEQQRKVNRMVQNQQWVHQDMIELLDIRTPKLYGWPSGYSMEGKKTTCPYNNRSGHRIATPFYEQWECGSGKSSEVIVAARGQWTGWMHVSINWDSGVIDDWAVEITPTDRIGSFTGGAYHIDIRSISVEVYPRSLNRKATIILFDDPPQDVWQKMFPGNLSGDDSRPRKKWDSYGDDNRLFRHMLKKRIRLKNTVTCDRNVWVRDEEGNRQQIRAGNNIYAAEIYPEDQDYANGTKFTFTEVDDPVRMDEADRFGYEVGKERPSGTPTSYESRVR